MVTAISLGLTVSFAALPVASAHTTHNVGHSHTVHAHQKYGVGQKHVTKPSSYHPNYHANQNEACERISGFSKNNNVALTSRDTPTTVASFLVPKNCANSIDVAVTFENKHFEDQEVDCQFSVNGTPTGKIFKTTLDDAEDDDSPVFGTLTAVLAEQPEGYAPYYSGSYSNYKPHLQLEEKSLDCTAKQVGEPDEEPENIFAVSESVQVVSQPHFATSYAANYADGSGYAARSIKHIIK